MAAGGGQVGEEGGDYEREVGDPNETGGEKGDEKEGDGGREAEKEPEGVPPPAGPAPRGPGEAFQYPRV